MSKVHDRATYGRFAHKLDELWLDWSQKDNAADYESYDNLLLNDAAEDAWDTYCEMVDEMTDNVEAPR